MPPENKKQHEDQPNANISRLPAERHANMLEQLLLYRRFFVETPRPALELIRSFIPSNEEETAHAVFVRDIRGKLLACQSLYEETVQMSAYGPENCCDFLFPLDCFPSLSAALGIYGTALAKLVRETEKWPSPDLHQLVPGNMHMPVPALALVRVSPICRGGKSACRPP